jgi:hypothetical protein
MYCMTCLPPYTKKSKVCRLRKSWIAQSFLKMSPLSFQNYASEKKSETTVELSSVSSCPLTRECTTNIKFTKNKISHHIMSKITFQNTTNLIIHAISVPLDEERYLRVVVLNLFHPRSHIRPWSLDMRSQSLKVLSVCKTKQETNI